MRYSIGTRLRVQVSRVDLDGRKIDFRLVQEPGSGAPEKAPGPKVPQRKASRASSDRGDREAGGKDAKAKKIPYKGKVRHEAHSRDVPRKRR